ncbi:hypothetical protein ASG29_06550 [Sphingomonas sp. Leaf412]|uniref:hypothetical protein n=1 Tax=Sphingomonas sp. Leaf412 TaxID=1736370 RepID=UPI0006F5B2CB|nr:hypothetical protein [Sphingomonas sp. Leaf412]KQT33666.1 hypothetical protein ASG29_06550 [Sphingomonas sp. Leaf412]
MNRLADDILRGAKAIAEFTGLEEWEVYYLKKSGALPVFKLPGCRGLFARKSEIERAFSARGLQAGGLAEAA